MKFRIREMAGEQAAKYPHALMGWDKDAPIWEIQRLWLGLFWCDVGRVFQTQDAALQWVARQSEPAGSWVEASP